MARIIALLGVVCTALVSQHPARRGALNALDKAIDISQPPVVVCVDDVQKLAQRLRANEAIDVLKEPDGVRAIFDDVISLAAKTKQPHGRTKDQARRLLSELGYAEADESSARELLVQAGVWNAHENLDVIRRGVPSAFDDDTKAEAQRCVDEPCADADADVRMDLTRLDAFAVDDASAMEIDDALSIEGDMLWVHVADPTRWVECGSPLDREARRRGASVYLPTGAVPMFPPAAVQLFSLDGDDRTETCAISVGVQIGKQGEIVGDPVVTTSRISVPRRLTYDAVDALLMDDASQDAAAATFRHLVEALARRREWRKRQGSLESLVSAQMPQMSVDVDASFTVAVSVAHQTPSRIVVQEAMLLFAHCVSAYSKKRRVPMPFRAQAAVPHSELADRLERIPEGLARTWYAVKKQKPARVVSKAKSHAGLGLESYVHATSPIRRYADVVAHFQLKASLRGIKGPFNAADVVQLANSKAAAVARQVANAAKKYWLREYLTQQASTRFDALVLEHSAEKASALVLLTTIGAILPLNSTKALSPGLAILVEATQHGEIRRVDPVA
ncbi:hypothetical protein M885DRAFT_531049 [Pelagophyceae sp. CCMP2097]|nr:hypothetical protein M885DRAFT_551777 [Pelagophyceae sp. CCMP2097]KAJ1450981.1 hypothetical protein M885DRAFT_531049 [Pelagophyceae sp. CCMP2097]